MMTQPAMNDLYEWIDHFAPFETQESFDNSGFLLGRRSDPVKRVLFALDITDRVLDEAEANDVNLIVTHHPLMFSPIQSLTEDTYEGRLICRMVRHHIGLIAAHTNLDRASGGINDTLAGLLGLCDVQGDGFLRYGRFPEAVPFAELIARSEQTLHTTVRVFGHLPPETAVQTMAVSSGAGSEFWSEAYAHGAQVFLTGELKHHHALALCASGMAGLEAGHFATEEPGIFALADALQSYVNEVKWNVTIFRTATGAYALPAEPTAGG